MMSDNITFTGVVLKSFSRNHNGGKANFSGNFAAKIGEKMGWAGFPAGATSVSLEGDIAASSAELQPVAGELSKWQITFAASAVKNFEAVRYELEGKKGKGHRYELHFIVEFKDMTACRFLEEFITHIGDHKSTLKVAYTKQAEQTTLADADGVTLEEERRQSTLEAND
jgi:hypothetical protein